jgi:hypothetical protein
MPRTNGWTVGILILAGLLLSACTRTSADMTIKDDKMKPVKVEPIEKTGLSRVILTARAAERLDVQTAPAVEVQVAQSPGQPPRKVVPYAAVLYDAQGDTWVYTSPEPLVYVRYPIKVDYIDGDQAVLSDGPPVGTQVVTLGGAELFGAEFEIGH